MLDRVARYEPRTVLPRGYDSLLDELAAPDELLVSEHAVPAPELVDRPGALGLAVFDAINTGASDAGLTDLGVLAGSPRRKQPPLVLWGADTESYIRDQTQELRNHPGDWGDWFGAWPWDPLIWTDPSRSTFLLVIADDHIRADWIVAWGRESERCLGVVEAALDDDSLWD